MTNSLYAPIKELGQNFLTDSESAFKMVNALDLLQDDVVVEIGPGLGVLTQELANKLMSPKAHIYAVEIDNRFVDKLSNMFLTNDTVEIVEANVLDWLSTFKHPDTRSLKVLGSLPYYITSPILHKIIEMPVQPALCVLLVQKEVAQRICNKAPDATYLSVFTQTFFDVTYLGKVDKSKFSPAPSVDGGIIKLQKKTSSITSEQLRKYSGFLHKGFSNPRKMLNKVFTKEELAKVNINSSLRAQDIEVDKWVELFTR